MKTPISVLTGLDYWLDNLMCNVPEVAMCFHINGIVQVRRSFEIGGLGVQDIKKTPFEYSLTLVCLSCMLSEN